MSVIAEAVRHMLAAGMEGDAIVAAIADMEAALSNDRPASSNPVLSAGALRMRRLRERHKTSPIVTERHDVTPCDAMPDQAESAGNAGVSALSGEVETASPSVTKRHRSVTRDGVVTRRSKKESSPTPPKEKTTTPNPPKGGFPPSVTGPVETGKLHVSQTDPMFAVLGKLRGRPYPVDSRGGWLIAVEEIAKAKGSPLIIDDPPNRQVEAV